MERMIKLDYYNFVTTNEKKIIAAKTKTQK